MLLICEWKCKMEGTTVALIGIVLNLLCLLHFSRKGGFALSRLQITLTLIALLAPILGTILYCIWYLWNPPTSAPYHLRQNEMNHRGRSAFSTGVGYLDKEFDDSKVHSTPQKKKEVSEQEQEPKSKFWQFASTVFFTLFGIMIIFSSVMTMSKGSFTYSNFWNLEVFAPTAIAMGGLLIYITLFKNKK